MQRLTFLVPTLCVAVVGCGSGDGRLDVYPVKGQVSYRGEPAEGARITLYSTAGHDAKTPIPSGVAQADGHFVLTSYADGDGAPAGTYKATIVWYAPMPPGVIREQYSPVDRLNGRYATPERSDLTVTVAEGENTLPPFELK